MNYPRKDPRYLIELEIVNAMQQSQIEGLINSAVESEADYQDEIAELKEALSKVCKVLKHQIQFISPAKARGDVEEMVLHAEDLIGHDHLAGIPE